MIEGLRREGEKSRTTRRMKGGGVSSSIYDSSNGDGRFPEQGGRDPVFWGGPSVKLCSLTQGFIQVILSKF